MRSVLWVGTTAVALLACGAAFSSVGCASKSTDSTSSTPVKSVGDLADNAHAVQAPPMSVDTASVTFAASAEVNAFKVGDTIVSGQKIMTPYMRKITAIKKSGSSVTFETTAGNLEDLFANADIEATTPFTDGDPEAALSDSYGSSTASPTSRNPALGPLLLPQSLLPQDVEVLPGGTKEFSLGNYGALILAGTAHLNVTQSSFGVSGNVEFAYSSSPRHVRLVLHGGIHVRLGAELTVGGEFNYDTPERNYGKAVPLGTIWVQAGIVPIPIVMNLEFKHNEEVSLSGEVDLKAGISANYALAAGVDYANGHWSPVFQQTAHVTHDATFVDPNLTVAVLYDPLNTYLNFEIFDVAGPFFGVAPYVGVQKNKEFKNQEANEANAGKAPSALFDGVYGIELEYGGEVELFGHNLGDMSAILFNAEGVFPVCARTALTCSAGDVPVIAHGR